MKCEQLEWGQGPITALSALSPGKPAAALLRHAAREPITDFATSEQAPLTAAGRQHARAVGRHLPPGRTLRLVYSTVERCADTAACIAEGYRSSGGEATLVGSVPALFTPYVRDLHALSRFTRELGARFMRAWFDGQLPESAVQPACFAAEDFRRTTLELLSHEPSTLTLMITHDWNILLLREIYLRLPHEEVGWADFLDGPVIAIEPEYLTLRWRDASTVWASGDGDTGDTK